MFHTKFHQNKVIKTIDPHDAERLSSLGIMGDQLCSSIFV